MSACGPVGLPRGVDHNFAAPPLGGQNGTVATPSRLAAVSDGLPTDAPGRRAPRGGQQGPILFGRFLPALDRNGPSYDPTFRVGEQIIMRTRRFYANCIPLAHYIMSIPATTAGTTNTVAGLDGGAGFRSPIPMDRRWRALSYYAPFNRGRVYSLYIARDRPQAPQARRSQIAGVGHVMSPPYRPRLTRWAAAPSYGQTTPTLGR